MRKIIIAPLCLFSFLPTHPHLSSMLPFILHSSYFSLFQFSVPFNSDFLVLVLLQLTFFILFWVLILYDHTISIYLFCCDRSLLFQSRFIQYPFFHVLFCYLQSSSITFLMHPIYSMFFLTYSSSALIPISQREQTHGFMCMHFHFSLLWK